MRTGDVAPAPAHPDSAPLGERAMRRRFLITAAVSALLTAVVVHAQPPSDGGGFREGRKGGPGGHGGMMSDPNAMFDRLANGKNVINRAELDERQQRFFDM